MLDSASAVDAPVIASTSGVVIRIGGKDECDDLGLVLQPDGKSGRIGLSITGLSALPSLTVCLRA